VSLGISVIGWTILALAFAPVLLLWLYVGRKHGASSGEFILTAIFTGLPFVAAIAEGAWVEYRWRALCATATTEVKRQVVVEGFYDDGFWSGGWWHIRYGKYGFRFIEWKDKQGQVWRSEGFEDPSGIRNVQIERPTARYEWRNPKFPTPIGHLLKRHEETIVDTQSGEVIARSVTGYRYPTFVDALWRGWFDGAPELCGSLREISGEVLIGIDQKERGK
jgi:hypothetical protein